MTTITITLPDAVARQLEAEHISQQQLDAVVVAALQTWLHHRQGSQDMGGQERPWSEAFQECADDFIDQLIDENKALFEELARL
jgi:hypothetical protein